MSRILIIEDTATFRQMLRATLEDMGHEVVETANGKLGIDRYRAEAFDVVMTDVIMPEKEGVETIIELRKFNPKVRIIAMSGGGALDASDYLGMALQLGAVRVLEKPFRQAELKSAIEAAVGLGS